MLGARQSHRKPANRNTRLCQLPKNCHEIHNAALNKPEVFGPARVAEFNEFFQAYPTHRDGNGGASLAANYVVVRRWLSTSVAQTESASGPDW
jgi:hypothetical protein